MNQVARPAWRRRIMLALGAGLLAASCTVASVEPRRPAERPTLLVLGEITVADALWETYRPHFMRGAEGWLRRHPGFEQVVVAPPTPLPAGSVVLVGTISELDRGDPKLRFFVRMGAGRAKVKGTFEIQGSDGGSYVRFDSEESYRGGAGGAGTLDLDDLFKRFGETVAETAARWARGEPLER